jgi:ABC-type multidrug transport system fused ATPase/permease subunit
VNTSQNSLSEYLYLPKRKKLIGLILVALGGASYLGYITPRLISELYASYDNKEKFYPILYKLGTLFVFEYLVQVTYQVSLTRYIQHLLQHIRTISFTNWIKSYESIGVGKHGDNKYPLGEVLARIISDTEAVIELVSSGSFKIFIDFAFIISCLISFISLNTTSGITLIITEVLACIVLVIGSKKMAKVYMEVRKSMGHMSRVVANITGGFPFTYHTPNNDYASEKSYDVFEDFLKKQLRANVWDASYFAIAESLFPILLAILVMIFPYSHIVEMAILAAIVDLIQRSIQPIKEVASKISSIQRAKSGIIRIQEFNKDILTLPKINFEDAFEKVDFKTLNVSVDHFSYPDKKKGEGQEQRKAFGLKDISFSAKAGELIGIVGLSGSGKSTLLKILSTDILAVDSEIKLETENGKDIVFSGKDFEGLDRYKRQVSIVSQDSHVFSESLRFNITFSDEENSDFDKFWETVVHDIPYLKSWGITGNTKIKVKELSLGQKQLISALRSCFLTKPIVLFDEISSGLDSELEEALRKLVLLIQRKSLTIIVAHRIETIVNAHQILVMENGQLVETGKHQELSQSSAVYQEFIAQLKTLHN